MRAALAVGVIVALAIAVVILAMDDDGGDGDSSAEKELAGLLDYNAPILVFDRVVLDHDEARSKPIPQRPVRLDDGHVERNKSIIVERGDFRETPATRAKRDDHGHVVEKASAGGTDFHRDPHGHSFMITLLVDGKPKGRASGLVRPKPFGVGIWCRDADAGTASRTSLNFNCLFRVSEVPGGDLKVRWTMAHK